MAISGTPIDSGSASSSSASTTSPSLTGTASSGSLLTAAVSMFGASGAITTPTGWTLANKHESADVSNVFFYKTSDGTETGVTINWTNNQNYQSYVAEFSSTDLDLSGTIVKAEDESNVGTVVTSQSSGTTSSSPVADSLAIAVFAAQRSSEVTNGRTYTSGYSEQFWVFENGSRCSLGVITKVLTVAEAQSCTFDTTDTGDEQYGQIIVFPGVGGAPTGNPWYYYANQQ